VSVGPSFMIRHCVQMSPLTLTLSDSTSHHTGFLWTTLLQNFNSISHPCLWVTSVAKWFWLQCSRCLVSWLCRPWFKTGPSVVIWSRFLTNIFSGQHTGSPVSSSICDWWLFKYIQAHGIVSATVLITEWHWHTNCQSNWFARAVGMSRPRPSVQPIMEYSGKKGVISIGCWFPIHIPCLQVWLSW